MTLPANKATTPFKTMDIKTALLSGGNRKRKSTSQVSKDEPKNKKLSVENSDHENDVAILEEACGITVVLQPSEIDSALGDCKENKDINTAKVEYPEDKSKDKLLNSPKGEKSSNLEKTSCDILKLVSPKSPKQVSDNDVELLSDKSIKSDDSSCDELSNSVNVSLNTSEMSVTGEDDKEHTSKSKVKEEGENKTEKAQTDTKDKVKKRKMTPAEAQKRAEEREQKQKERLLKKQEFENKKRERQLEKEQKLKEKMLRKEREEMERKERERIKQEKKEQEEQERLKRQKEKEEKAKLKQLQLEQKLEEKKKKEEIRLKKEEELKKAEEEKQRAKEKEQKEKEKQERAKAAFAKFFLKAENNASTTPTLISEKGAFLPFQVSDDMTLAPVVPPAAQERFDKKQLDHYLEFQDDKKLYLDILKSGMYKDVRHRKKNKKLEDSEVIIIDKNAQTELGLHPKLFQFHENVRPPYWGTWRKKSRNIRPRNPFGQDELFDYDVDSDDEWDEGGPGESLSGTENEDDMNESEDDYEVDNEFFVPHGYLSDEEEKKEDDDEEVNDPEKQKALLKLKLQEFEMERKKKTTELKPIILGCYFTNHPAYQDSGLHMFLETYCAEILSENPIPTSFTIKSQQSESGSNTTESPKSANNGNSAKKKYAQSMPEKAFPHLILLVHGNTKNKRILAEEFQKFWLEQSGEKSDAKQKSIEPSSNVESAPCKDGVDEVPANSSQISLRLLNQTIREIASYGKSPDSTFNKYCWWVNDNIREKFGLLDAPIPNQWKYMSQKEPELPSKNNSTSIKEFLSAN